MSVDLEARVRRANLISRNHQLERLYGDDLSRRLLRDVYSKKEGRMSEMTDRPARSTVEDVPAEEKAFRPTRSKQKRSPALVPAILTAVIAVGVIVALVARQPAPVAQTPVEIAEAFMAALNEHDAAAVTALLANEDAITPEAASDEIVVTIEKQLEQEAVLGWTYDRAVCVDRTSENEGSRSEVTCTYSITDDITRALGNEPYEGSRYEFVVVDDKIVSAENSEQDEQYHDETITPFRQWLRTNHGVDIAYEYRNEANLAELEEYVPEFVAAMEGTG